MSDIPPAATKRHRTEAPGPDDLSSCADEKPTQPKLHPFPLFGTTGRRFNPDWYGMFQWVEYSQKANAVFCYACRHYVIAGYNAYRTKGMQNFAQGKKR